MICDPCPKCGGFDIKIKRDYFGLDIFECQNPQCDSVTRRPTAMDDRPTEYQKREGDK